MRLHVQHLDFTALEVASSPVEYGRCRSTLRRPLLILVAVAVLQICASPLVPPTPSPQKTARGRVSHSEIICLINMQGTQNTCAMFPKGKKFRNESLFGAEKHLRLCAPGSWAPGIAWCIVVPPCCIQSVSNLVITSALLLSVCDETTTCDG